MTNIIKHKRSTTPGAVPTPENLVIGELAVNAADGKLFTRTATGGVVELTAPTVVDGGEIVYDSLLTGLQAFWLFDQKIGSVDDVSGNNNKLFPCSLNFETSAGVQASSVQLSHKNFLYANTAFPSRRSLSFWVKASQQPNTDTTFISFGAYGAAVAEAGVVLTTSSAIRWTELLHENSLFTAETATGFDSGWNHIALVREPSQTSATSNPELKIYINGEPAAETPVPYEELGDNNNFVLTIGLFNSVAIAVDCFGIWDRALTPAEVSRLANQYAPPAPPSVPIDPTTFINFSVDDVITSLSISVDGSTAVLFPSFSADNYDYGVLTGSAVPDTPVSYTLTINGTPVNGAGAVGRLIRVNYGNTAYYIRLFPADMPLGVVTTPPGVDYIPGYYVTTSQRIEGAANYNIVYDEHGLPIWYAKNVGVAPHLHQPGHDRGRLAVSRNGEGPRFLMQVNNDGITARALSFLPTTRNSNMYSYAFGNHEFFEVAGPLTRRGNIIYNTFVATPQENSQAFTDKAYGVYVQEQTPDGAIAWEWWTSDRFDQTPLARNASFFHMNSVAAHPVTGDMLFSCRQCSAIVCVDYATKDVKWVLQGSSQPWGNIAQTANAETLASAQFLTLEGEPELSGYQYLGPEGQHHALWATHIDPLTPGNAVITVFDNQAGFFAGSTSAPKTVTALVQSDTTVTGTTSSAHNFANNSYVKIAGANENTFNGIFAVTVINPTTFTYTTSAAPDTTTATGSITATRALTYWPHSEQSPAARGVIYEIDLANGKAIHRGSAFAPNGTSGYLGSYHVMLHETGVYSHVLNFTQQHPQLIEYADAGDGASPGAIIFAVDFPGDLYRITKVSKDFFNLDYLRVTAGLPITVL